MSAPQVEERGEARQSLGPSLLNLPTELIERILDTAIYEQSTITTTASLDASLRFYSAGKYSLVCRLFYLIARPKMYKQVTISIRQMPSFLSTIKANCEIARSIKEMTLEGRIWTDIDQDVVIGILLAVRETCVRVKLGANESMLLPYLLHGPPDPSSNENSAVLGRNECALQVLNICWRDEVQVHSQWQHLNKEREEQDTADTLYHLFQHKVQPRINASQSHHQDLPRLTHLTLDVYSQRQLDQIFDSNGYFVKMLLPRLTFLRIEMPLVVLQFTCTQAGDLVRGWPKDDDTFLKDTNLESIQEAIEVRQDHTRRVIAKAEDLQERQSQEDMIMPYCPANQLKSLTMRFLLNVHRNDMMLFKLTCPVKALEQSWSTRASVAAHCLSSTMQMYLNDPASNDDGIEDKRDRESRICSFPFAQYKSKGAEVYWKQKWAEAEAGCNASLPAEIRAATTTQTPQLQTDDTSTKVSLLLKWPHAVDAFFHYSAMI
jgi:hypothetical protein